VLQLSFPIPDGRLSVFSLDALKRVPLLVDTVKFRSEKPKARIIGVRRGLNVRIRLHLITQLMKAAPQHIC
jgi:hypothetical protein